MNQIAIVRNDNREAWIDNVKMFAILCVVVSHCFHYFTLQPYEAFPVRPLINAFNMHLFALVSGINAFRSISKIYNVQSYVNYIDKIVQRIVLPCVAYSILYRILNRIIEHSVLGAALWIGLFLLFCAVVCFISTNFSHSSGTQQKTLDKAFFLSIISYGLKSFLLVFSCSHYADWFFRFLLVTLILMSLSTLISRVVTKGNKQLILSLPLFLLMAFCIPVFGLSELAIVFAIGYTISAMGYKICDNRIVAISLFIVGFVFFWLSFYAFGRTEHHTFYQTSVNQLIREGIWYILVLRQLCAISLSYAFIAFIKSFSTELI